MEIKIRGVSPITVKKLDELAAKKKISRNELLKKYIESFAIQDDLKNMEDKYSTLVLKLSDVIERNTNALEEVSKIER